MVEITTKYKIGTRRFGLINWIGAWTLYKKEVLRFLIVWVQTIFSPIVTSLLFLLVLSLAIGNERSDVLGVPFVSFLAPGLIAMQIIQQSFSHSSSSFMIGKIQGNIVDILYAPLSAAEVTLAITLAAVTRSAIIAFISVIIFVFLIDIEIKNYYTLIIFTLLIRSTRCALGPNNGIFLMEYFKRNQLHFFYFVPFLSPIISCSSLPLRSRP